MQALAEHHSREIHTIVRAEKMLAVAEVTAIVDLETMGFLAARFEHCLGMIDAAEPARRLELERLVAKDFDELASAYKVLAWAFEQNGGA